MIDWRPLFPLPVPRPQQERALDDLCQAVEGGKRLLVLEAGTGVGKSAVAVCFGRWLCAREEAQEPWERGTVVITAQRVLQDQYVRDFSEAQDLRSAQNFRCHGPMGGTCGETWRVRKAVGQAHQASLRCEACPYRIAKERFKSGPLGITNYSYHLSEAVYAGELPLRQLLVLDECHHVEDEVRRWSTVEISADEAQERDEPIPFGASPAEAIAWLRDRFKKSVEERLALLGGRLQTIVAKGNLRDRLIPRLAEENDRLDKRKCQINRLVEFGGEVLVSYHEATRRTPASVRFQPLEVGGLAQELLYGRASACLLMSATVLDLKIFSRACGIRGAHFASIPTPFRPEAFGVRLRPVGKMKRPDIDRTIRLIPRAIRKILADHPDEKGIVHTTNYRIAEAVAEAGDPRLLVQLRARDREALLREHLESPRPTVLVSPGMTEGLDLKDDLGRFQVLVKVPYPDVSDPVVKRKPWDWYVWRTARAFAQAAGRSVRSETDHTTTYVLDECFIDFLEKNGRLVPEHLTKSIEVEEPF